MSGNFQGEPSLRSIKNRKKDLISTLVYYEPSNFQQHELVDSSTLKLYESMGWDVLRLFHPTILFSADKLRDKLGVKCTINNWKFGGNREWSGYRTPESPYFSPYSQHNGKAVDIIIDGFCVDDYSDLRREMVDNPWETAWKYVTRVEMTKNHVPISWLHIDVACHDKSSLGIKEIHV